jgi:outer membrane protein assembly factor BamD
MAVVGCNKKDDIYKNMTAQQIYERGKSAAARKDYPQAIKDFDTLEARYPYGEWTDKGQLALIDAYSKGDDEGSALAAADRFIRVHPRHPNVDYAYYMKGVVNFNENFSLVFRNMPLDRSMRDSTYAQKSFDDFRTLIEKFPNSKYAPDARKRMILMREQLADHELHIAKYYLTQGADLAAANRAGYIVNQFPRTPAAYEALKIMTKTYKDLGMLQEANEAQAVLKDNFPNGLPS